MRGSTAFRDHPTRAPKETGTKEFEGVCRAAGWQESKVHRRTPHGTHEMSGFVVVAESHSCRRILVNLGVSGWGSGVSDWVSGPFSGWFWSRFWDGLPVLSGGRSPRPPVLISVLGKDTGFGLFMVVLGVFRGFCMFACFFIYFTFCGYPVHNIPSIAVHFSLFFSSLFPISFPSVSLSQSAKTSLKSATVGAGRRQATCPSNSREAVCTELSPVANSSVAKELRRSRKALMSGGLS